MQIKVPPGQLQLHLHACMLIPLQWEDGLTAMFIVISLSQLP